jgi:hypothetical protein
MGDRPPPLCLVGGMIDIKRGEHVAIGLQFPDWIEALRLRTLTTEYYVNKLYLFHDSTTHRGESFSSSSRTLQPIDVDLFFIFFNI